MTTQNTATGQTMIDQMTKDELLGTIIIDTDLPAENADLERYEAASRDELIDIIRRWVEAGDECASC